MPCAHIGARVGEYERDIDEETDCGGVRDDQHPLGEDVNREEVVR